MKRSGNKKTLNGGPDFELTVGSCLRFGALAAPKLF